MTAGEANQRIGFTHGRWAWLIQYVPPLLAFLAYWICGHVGYNLQAKHPNYWIFIALGLWSYLTVYFVTTIIFRRLFQSVLPTAIFACFYFVLYGVNAGCLLHTGRRLELSYVNMIQGSNWTQYLTPPIWGIIGAVILSGVLACWLASRNREHYTQRRLWLFAVQLLLLIGFKYSAVYDLSAWMVFDNTTFNAQKLTRDEDQIDSLRAFSENSLALLGRELWKLNDHYYLVPTSSLALYTNTIQELGLTLGPKSYPVLPVKPFDRIVLFASESVSLDFLAPYNRALPVETTPFYASLANPEQVMRNYKPGALFTHPALQIAYTSHPNPNAGRQGANLHSLPKMLAQAGYHTIFLRSDSAKFSGEDSAWHDLGFQEVIGLEDFRHETKYAKYIEGWGLMDRKLFEKLITVLEVHRHQRVFVHVTTLDTHPPAGRDSYGDLAYPPLPPAIESIPNPETRRLMRAIFRHDYDLGEAIKQMKQHQLLTDDSLVVISADHCLPRNRLLDNVPGYRNELVARIPLAFLSGQPLPPLDYHQTCSQLDFAPTLAHLLALPIPEGWWGRSLFAPHSHSIAMTLYGNGERLIWSDGNATKNLSLTHPQTTCERELARLYYTIFTNAPAFNTKSPSPLPRAEIIFRK